VNFGESSIGVKIKEPFGYTDYRNVPNGPSPAATFTIPGNAVPTGYTYEVCAGTRVVSVVLPHCQMFHRSQEGDSMVTVTP
jgi:hypothetical protein